MQQEITVDRRKDEAEEGSSDSTESCLPYPPRPHVTEPIKSCGHQLPAKFNVE